jgi:tetratricopeptide (TPR) repeat protein
LDHVHPTIEVNRWIALWVLEELRAANWHQGTIPSDVEIERVQQEVEASLDLKAQGIAFRNLAKVLHWAGKFDEAIPRARDAIRLLPADLESRFVLADCLFQTGRIHDARSEYEALFRIGDYPRAHLPFGEVLCDLGDFREATHFLVQALLSERPDHQARAYYVLGLAYLQLGEFSLAAKSLRESDRRFPQDPATLALIAEAELAQGNWQACQQELLRITNLDPDNFYAHFRLAEILQQNDRLPDALEHAMEAVRLESANAEAIRLRNTIQQQLQGDAPE